MVNRPVYFFFFCLFDHCRQESKRKRTVRNVNRFMPFNILWKNHRDLKFINFRYFPVFSFLSQPSLLLLQDIISFFSFVYVSNFEKSVCFCLPFLFFSIEEKRLCAFFCRKPEIFSNRITSSSWSFCFHGNIISFSR